MAAVQAEKEKEKAAAAAEKAALAASAASNTVGSQQSSAQIKAQMEQEYCSSSKGDLVLDLKRNLKPSPPTQRASLGGGAPLPKTQIQNISCA